MSHSADPQHPASTDVPPLVDRLFRDEAGRLTAVLAGILGPAHLTLAEDVTQEAFIAALRRWPHDGIPTRPSAWLLQVARRKAIDALRRDRALADRLPAVLAEMDRLTSEVEHPAVDAGDPFADDRLRMILLCCHPAVSEDSRVALTLKLVSGLGVGEIARAFLAEEGAVAQRLVRAKRALRAMGATFAMPEGAELIARLDAVHAVLYLMFNEGHSAHQGEALLRRDLCFEALRLAERLVGHPTTESPEGHALAALFAFHAARLDARTDAQGRLVTLADQDRSRWDHGLISRGFHHLERAAAGNQLTAHHLEAELASLHAVAPTWEETDWARMVAAYDRLVARTGSPVAALNRAVAVRELRGAAAALTDLERIAGAEELGRYSPYHAVRGDLLEALGRVGEAERAWASARELARSVPVQHHISQRIQALSGADVDLADHGSS